MSNEYTGPTPFNISISEVGETTIAVAGNDGIILGPLGGNYAKYYPNELAQAKQQVAGFLATISAGEPIASLTKLNLNLNNLYNACAPKTGIVFNAKTRDENVKSIIRLCAAQANVAFPAVAGGDDTQELRDDTNTLVDGKAISTRIPGDKKVLAVAAFYNIRKTILNKIDANKGYATFNILKSFTGDQLATLPNDLAVDISNIKTVIALVKDAIDNDMKTLNTNTNTANKQATQIKKDAAAKKLIDDADAAKKLLDDAAKKLAENKKEAAQKDIDAHFVAAVADKDFNDAADAAAAVVLAAADAVTVAAAVADIEKVKPITALKVAVRNLATIGTPETLPGGTTYADAKTVVDAIKPAGGGVPLAPLAPLLAAAVAWFDTYVPVATEAKRLADLVLVGGARKNTRRRSYGRGGRRKSYRRRRY